MSNSPKTPAAPAKTSALETTGKRRRTVAKTPMAEENQDMEDDGPAIVSLASTNKELARQTFGEDLTWAGSRYFGAIETLEGRRSAQKSIHLLMTFATAHDTAVRFGPGNRYDARFPGLVTDMVVEQWGVRPEQVERLSSSGSKCIRFLLSFDLADLKKLTRKMPKGWVKLGRGLGCRLLCPAESFRIPFPVTVLNVPAFLDLEEVRRRLEREPFVKKVTELQRVVLENGVHTDKVDAMLEDVPSGNSPVSRYLEELDFSFDIHGYKMSLKRRMPCTACGDEDHLVTSCMVRQRLLAADVKGLSFVIATNEDKDGDGAPQEVAKVVVPQAEVTNSTTVEDKSAEKAGKKKKRDRKRKAVAEEGQPAAAKKAKVDG